jgi:hypothetical protein
MFQPVTKENKEELQKVTEGTGLKITSQQKESEVKESTGKDSDGPLQGEGEGLKVCLTALIIINNNNFYIYILSVCLQMLLCSVLLDHFPVCHCGLIPPPSLINFYNLFFFFANKISYEGNSFFMSSRSFYKQMKHHCHCYYSRSEPLACFMTTKIILSLK